MPPRVLLYGTEGIGKSTFGSQALRPVFIQTEDGLDEIDTDKFPLATSYEHVVAALATTVQLDLRLLEADQIATPDLNPLRTSSVDGSVFDDAGSFTWHCGWPALKTG